VNFHALLPIKDHSERVPGKNFKPLLGKPLWEHVVATLHAMDEVVTIHIDTDSQRFTAEVLAPYPKVRIIPRPMELCGDFVATNKLFAHDLTEIADDGLPLLQTHTTNPLLTAGTLRRSFQQFDDALKAGHADSLFSVTPYFARFYRRDLTAINHDPKALLRTQDLDPLLEENSNFYLFTRASFAATGARIGARPALFEMDRLEATDIDDEASWLLAEALLKMKADGRWGN